IQRTPHEIEPARSVTDMQVQDPGLVGHEPRDVRIGRDAQKLIERRLTRAMVADRELPDADAAVDVRDVAAHAAGQRRERHVVPTGPTPSADALLAEA